jgi:phosphoribosylaminoimidazole-succinocarboxamide synthase
MDLQRVLKQENLQYRGKSKDVYRIPDGDYSGKYAMVFTDRGTGYLGADGRPVFDPGYDIVVGSIPGKGAIACKFASHFFKLLKAKNTPSHFIAAIDNVMIVEPAVPISMAAESPEFPGSAPLLNLEFTWRNQATGSFWRRYPFLRPCRKLDMPVETWTKGDSDILITNESLAAAGVMTPKEIERVDQLVKKIARVVSEEFAAKGMHVIDGKFELGRLKSGTGEIVLIDEISPDVIRVCRGYDPDANGHCKAYHDCIKTTYADGKRTIKMKNQLAAAELEKAFLGQ